MPVIILERGHSRHGYESGPIFVDIRSCRHYRAYNLGSETRETELTPFVPA